MPEWICRRTSVAEVAGSIPQSASHPINGYLCWKKKSTYITEGPEYTGTYVLVKSVESKVPTAYDVARSFRWVPAQVSSSLLDQGSKLRGPSPIALV